MVAKDNTAVQFMQPSNHFTRLGAKCGDIAQTNRLIYLLSFNIRKNRIQRNAIAVYFGGEGNTQERWSLCSLITLMKIYASLFQCWY